MIRFGATIIGLLLCVASQPQTQNNKQSRSTRATREIVVLGERLYFDKRLSADGTVSCASCHDPATAFTSRDTVAVGIRNQRGTRNAPTLLNVKFGESFFWDGRALSLEDQAKHPLLNAAEMGLENESALVARLSSIPEYREAFRRTFPRGGITLDNAAKAIAAYERTLLSKDSPFDRFMEGDGNAITKNQKKGWELFKGKAKCIDCHPYTKSSPFFTDSKFYNTGISISEQTFSELERRAQEIVGRATDPGSLAHEAGFSELGRFLVTQRSSDIGAFKTPTLRDIELTWPYMHDGSIRTLLDVMRFYNQGGGKNPNLDAKLQPLHLTDEEMNCIVEFMRSLTSESVLRQAQLAVPQSRK